MSEHFNSREAGREAGHPIIKRLANNVRAERLRQHLTIQQLADKLGVHKSNVSRIESGLHAMTVVGLANLAKALKVDPKDLL